MGEGEGVLGGEYATAKYTYHVGEGRIVLVPLVGFGFPGEKGYLR